MGFERLGRAEAVASITRAGTEVVYPESDGKPMAETPIHRDVMTDLIAVLQDWFAADPLVYVSGNMFVYFVEGDPRRNVSPDVMVARGVDKSVERGTYKTWLEGRSLDLVIEVSSPKTRREDVRHKFGLYQDVLRVPEYYLFDPLGEYLDPPLQGHRLVDGAYQAIEPVAGRLPSEVLGLHLEAAGRELRLFDPVAGRRLLTRKEDAQEQRAIAERQQAALGAKDREIERLHARNHVITEELLQQQREILDLQQELLAAKEAEIERLRRELEALQAGRGNP